MKTATLSQVRNDFPSVLAWVANGEEVTVLNRTQPVARLCPLPYKRTPVKPDAGKKVVWPDFAARRKAIFGDSPPIPNPILEEREQSRW